MFIFAPMSKSIIAISLSFVLVFSILGPIFLKLYNSDISAIALVEIVDEEQKKETGSSDLEDIKIFEKSHADLRTIFNQIDEALSNYNQNLSPSDYLEIQLPPPRYSA
jgi:predicted PurR-regulated permease PerM